MFPRKKIRKLRSSNCWKCTELTEMVNLNITVLFLYHLKIFYDPIRRTSVLVLGGVRAHPAHPPPPTPTALPYALWQESITRSVYLTPDCVLGL